MEREDLDMAATVARRGAPAVDEDGQSSERDEDLDLTLESSSAPFARPGPLDTIARFKVLDRLGAGGMGVVYAAWDPKLDRRVAVKLVRPNKASTAAHERLLREAQAMARLNHPNVVSVYDVGTHERAVWIAMEYVEGSTLQAWRVDDSHGWAEILALYRQAGEGLAAAHAAGLVHRDFKPDNVLIGRDGRARVADFGLVRPVDVGPGQSGAEMEQTQDESGHGTVDEGRGSFDERRLPGPGEGPTLSSELTAAGALLGTPRYMSPEQFSREPADARSDQFAFCVALYIALYDCRPFEGERLFELAAAVTLGSPRPVPRDSPVPTRVGQAILRGLSRDPGDRFPDVQALLEALDVQPRVRRWPRALGLGVVAALSAGTAVWISHDEPTPIDVCAAGEAQATTTWGRQRRAELRAHFEALDIGFADSSLAAIDEGLSAWTGAWSQAYVGVCETRHEQSAALYDLRMACLSERREQVEGLVALLAQADAALVRDGPELVSQLPDMARCARVQTLHAVAPPPAGDRSEVKDLREELARVRAGLEAKRVDGLEHTLAQLDARANAIGYAPLEIELDLAEARLRAFERDSSTTRELLLGAHERALALGYDRAALDSAKLLIRLDYVDGPSVGASLATRWFTVASGLERRLGSDPHDEAERRQAYGRALAEALRFPEATAQLVAAVELMVSSVGPDSLETARAQLAAASTFGGLGDWTRANDYLARGLQTYEARLEPHHPLLLVPLEAQVGQSLNAGALDAALAAALRMLEISEAAYGPEHPETLESLLQLAQVNDLRGDHDQARAELERVLELTGETEVVTTAGGVRVANSLCFALYKLDEHDLARDVCEQTLAGAGRVHGESHAVLAVILNNLALIDRAEGRLADSLAHDRRALEICEASVGPDHFYTAYALIGLGEGMLARARYGEAAAVLERALAIRVEVGEPGEVGEAECLLGQVLLEGGRDRDRGRALGRAGAERLRAAGPNWAGHAQTCADWLDL